MAAGSSQAAPLTGRSDITEAPDGTALLGGSHAPRLRDVAA